MSVYERIEKLEERMEWLDDVIYHLRNLVKLIDVNEDKDAHDIFEQYVFDYEYELQEDEEIYFRLKKGIGKLL